MDIEGARRGLSPECSCRPNPARGDRGSRARGSTICSRYAQLPVERPLTRSC
jgi:hypothetical protein